MVALDDGGVFIRSMASGRFFMVFWRGFLILDCWEFDDLVVELRVLFCLLAFLQRLQRTNTHPQSHIHSDRSLFIITVIIIIIGYIYITYTPKLSHINHGLPTRCQPPRLKSRPHRPHKHLRHRSCNSNKTNPRTRYPQTLSNVTTLRRPINKDLSKTK